jgi:hypothetical protein
MKHFVLLIGCLCFSWAFARGADEGDSERRYREQYGLIVERNIFARDRSVRSRLTGPTTRAAPARPEQSLVLTGVVRLELGGGEEDEYLVFIEDVRVGTTQKFRVGDKIAQGIVRSIGFDSIEYEGNGRIVKVEIGNNLDREVTMASSASAASSTQPSVLGTDSGSGDVVERMRRRRAEELRR